MALFIFIWILTVVHFIALNVAIEIVNVLTSAEAGHGTHAVS